MKASSRIDFGNRVQDARMQRGESQSNPTVQARHARDLEGAPIDSTRVFHVWILRLEGTYILSAEESFAGCRQPVFTEMILDCGDGEDTETRSVFDRHKHSPLHHRYLQSNWFRHFPRPIARKFNAFT